VSLAPVIVVARKELTDAFRDRRSLYTMLLTALCGPLLISFILKEQTVEKQAADELRLPVAGRENAPVLMRWLEQQSGVDVLPAPPDPEAAVGERQEDVVLVIRNDFMDDFRDSKSAQVQVFSDSTRTSARPKVKRLVLLLDQFSAEIAGLRLVVRGVSPAVASPLKVEEVDVANSQQRAATLLGVILTFLTIAVLTAGMQVATDSTAGERERGSLEPLLLNPVPRWQLIGGKWLAASATAFAGLVTTLAVIALAVRRLPLEELGARVRLGQHEIALLIATMAPLALVLPALQAYLSCFAKSFKEAQSYTVFLVLPVGLIGVLSTYFPVTNRLWVQAIPVLAQYSLGTQVLANKTPSLVAMTAAASEAAVLTAVFVWLAARLLSTEGIICGG
jgi:sodium transport system permease protein